MDRYINYINGEWRDSAGKKTFTDINPSDSRDLIGEFADSTPEDVKIAINSANNSFSKWASFSSVKRAEFLYKAADFLGANVDNIAYGMSRENGKCIDEAKGEVIRGVAILRYYAGEGTRNSGEVIPSSNPNSLLYTKRVPLGAVGIITPWNFPLAIPLWKLSPALIFGNTVVFKPSFYTPWVGIKIMEAFIHAGLPEGVLNMVTGRGSIVGEALVSSSGINGVSFTGSNETGRKIAKEASLHKIKYQLEMGGKNPVIIMPDANMEMAVELTVSGAMRYAGQKCTATSRAIVIESVADEFTERLVNKVKSLKIGKATEPDTYVGPVISEEAQDRIMGYIEKGKKEARLLYGGKPLKEGEFKNGFYIEPAVFTDVRPDMTIAQEEIFGPVLSIIKAKDFEDAIRIANNVSFGLSVSIFTKDVNCIMNYVDKIESGMIRVNTETTGLEPQAPFGGMKDSSSYSREMGRSSIEFFTQIKTVYIDYSR